MNNISCSIIKRLNENWDDGEIAVEEDEFEEEDFIGSVKSSKGIYFGDPCYVLNDDDYDFIWGDQNGFKDGVIPIRKGLSFVVHRTAFGDGAYYGFNYPHQYTYPVDSGCLAIIPVELLDPEKAKRANELGHIFEGSKEAMMSYKEGVFKIDFDNIDSFLVDTNI